MTLAAPQPIVRHGCPTCRGDLLWDVLDQHYTCLLCGRAPDPDASRDERGQIPPGETMSLEELIDRFT